MGKSKSFLEVLENNVLCSNHVQGNSSYNWIEVTYKTLVDLGLCEVSGDYIGSAGHIPPKCREAMTKKLNELKSNIK